MGGLVAGPVRVRVPASSANLGPGYDALGLALALHDVVTAEVVDRPAGTVEVGCDGEGAGSVPRDETHLVHRAMVAGFGRMGVEVPGLLLHCANAVPHGRGLGSSSAAIVAGLWAARALVDDGAERLDDAGVLALAADLEGHPDNVAPAVLGGFTVAWGEPGDFRAVRLDVTAPVAFVVAIPPSPLQTAVARGLLPASVPHADAARNAGRAALLVAALTSGAAGGDLWETLLAATEDRLHQDHRAPVMPGSADLVRRLREAGTPAVVSGAGPTVLAMAAPGREPELVAEMERLVPSGWTVAALPVDTAGACEIPAG